MLMTITSLRQQLFKVVDQVIKTGIPVKINRNGHTLKIVLEEKKSKLSNLVQHECINGNSDDLVNLSVSTWDEKTEL